MNIVSIGGGPAGLYFGILMKKAFPEVDITIFERNRADDTFGWGVVFSDETLDGFRAADAESFEAITESFAYWGDIETYYGGECIRSTGHGFCGLSRKRLLEIMHDRCRALGVKLQFETDIDEPRAIAREADLLLGADGVNSLVRKTWSDAFRPDIEWGACRFTWLGTDKPLKAFTFIFRENEHGLFRVHAYPFQPDRSTFIVECRAETLARTGLEGRDESETVAYFEELFADHLDGHRLLTNRSIWRTFPFIKNETWHHKNVVLLGDSAHTAHFSIGSGTKLAMEDAMALVDAFRQHGQDDVEGALAAYEESRWVDAIKLQKTARTSQAWFEDTELYAGQSPVQFTFNLLTRSKRITYENLAIRDPDFVALATESFARDQGMPKASDCEWPKPMYAPFELRGMRLENRVVVSPMCQYSAVDGVPQDWHLMHLGARAAGGAGLVITEMTNVEPNGRISPGCAGIWNDEQLTAWKRIVDFVHEHTHAKIAMQIAHAGRKGACSRPWEGDAPLPADDAWPTIAPSAIPFDEDWPVPREMDRDDMDRIKEAFVDAARRADAAGFDMIELHGAHGYLLSSFISPVSNRRNDEYGGSLDNRLRYPLEVLDAVREAWPSSKPISVRISASDWMPAGEEGLTADDAVKIARALKEHDCDVVDVSSGGNTPRSQPVYGRMYQVPFAVRIKREVDIPVIAVGAIQGPDHVNTILAAGRADLCAMARPHLVSPHIVLEAAFADAYPDQFWPKQYERARPTPR